MPVALTERDQVSLATIAALGPVLTTEGEAVVADIGKRCVVQLLAQIEIEMQGADAPTEDECRESH